MSRNEYRFRDSKCAPKCRYLAGRHVNVFENVFPASGVGIHEIVYKRPGRRAEKHGASDGSRRRSSVEIASDTFCAPPKPNLILYNNILD